MEAILKVSDAFVAFTSGNYVLALNLYRQLSDKFGENLFSANIKLCERRIRDTGERNTAISTLTTDSKKLNPILDDKENVEYLKLQNHIVISKSTVSKVVLQDEPVWFELAVTDADFVQLFININYVGIPTNEAKKALLLLECLDAAGNSLIGPYPGFIRSDTVGWFKYLYPKQGASESVVDLRFCKGAKRARLGLRSFYTQAEEQVLVNSQIGLKWLDNKNTSEMDETLASAQFSSRLPFDRPAGLSRRKPRVASILDSFSHACFEPECDLVSVSPSGWCHELIGKQIDFVFVESAWHGNKDSWLYRVASYEKPPGDELSDIIRWARKFGVPTVFWNKEDPPNFDRFIDRAVEFDYIFTTDENCIERYSKRVGSSRFVGALPFAAQPKIHNPILNQPRLDATSFAGTYYADDFETRRRAMDMLLRVASRFGLDIFDRMHGISTKDQVRYKFPPDLQPFIRGSLNYSEMLAAYRRYRVALNVNSVSDSPTMFSRRVFELLACGTPVVSTESLGIDMIFKGLVPTVETEREAVECIERLMLNPGEWLRASVNGTRAVFSEHTYAHRLATITRAIGLSSQPKPVLSTVILVRTSGDPLRLTQMISQQKELPLAIVVIGTTAGDQTVKYWVDSLKSCDLQVIGIPASNLQSYLRNRHPDTTIAFMDGTHYYGPSYLLDARISLEGALTSDASGISTRHMELAISERLKFEDVSKIGMFVDDVDIASLALSSCNSNFVEALSGFLAGSTPQKLIVRSRPPFDFLPNFSDFSKIQKVNLG